MESNHIQQKTNDESKKSILHFSTSRRFGHQCQSHATGCVGATFQTGLGWAARICSTSQTFRGGSKLRTPEPTVFLRNHLTILTFVAPKFDPDLAGWFLCLSMGTGSFVAFYCWTNCCPFQLWTVSPKIPAILTTPFEQRRKQPLLEVESYLTQNCPLCVWVRRASNLFNLTTISALSPQECDVFMPWGPVHVSLLLQWQNLQQNGYLHQLLTR